MSRPADETARIKSSAGLVLFALVYALVGIAGYTWLMTSPDINGAADAPDTVTSLGAPAPHAASNRPAFSLAEIAECRQRLARDSRPPPPPLAPPSHPRVDRDRDDPLLAPIEYPSAPIRVLGAHEMAIDMHWFADPLKGVPSRPAEVVERQKRIAALFEKQYPPNFKSGYAIAERFPLPQVGFLISFGENYCWFGPDACAEANATKGRRSTFSPDTHIRDIVASVFLKCAPHMAEVWGQPPCFAIDIGSGFGLHAVTMARLGGKVLALEPMTDLCLASQMTLNLLDKQTSVRIVCAGISHELEPPPDGRVLVLPQNTSWYGGHRRTSFPLPPVPLFGVGELVRNVPARLPIKLVKIDTESVDCVALAHFVDLMVARTLLPVQNFVVEASEAACLHVLAVQLARLEAMGYAIYRTGVTERTFDERNFDARNAFRAVAVADGWEEVFAQRFSLVLWRALPGRVQWARLGDLDFGVDHRTGAQLWQLFITLEEF